MIVHDICFSTGTDPPKLWVGPCFLSLLRASHLFSFSFLTTPSFHLYPYKSFPILCLLALLYRLLSTARGSQRARGINSREKDCCYLFLLLPPPPSHHHSLLIITFFFPSISFSFPSFLCTLRSFPYPPSLFVSPLFLLPLLVFPGWVRDVFCL